MWMEFSDWPLTSDALRVEPPSTSQLKDWTLCCYNITLADWQTFDDT
jgi:hypothetical protein